jgi:hypothetical protein
LDQFFAGMTDDAARPRLAGAASSLVSPTADQPPEETEIGRHLHHAPRQSSATGMAASLLMQTPFKKGGYSPKMVRV